ncbi:flavodoxin family protein [Christensenellaceae bacterium OttesenSCG-928-L17]|nr:flavodoxin family protein [Christensenellaceae bacterium OttesenSCG-928-L17]
MCKKILVLTGSPNREGNSTKMADAFIRGAEQAGHSVTKFETAFKNMRGFTSEPDDMVALIPLMNACDVLLIATPLYWFSFPAQLKAVIDQLDYSEESKMLNKDSYFFISGGEKDDDTYQLITSLYHKITAYLAWQEKGMLQARGLDAPGEIEKSGLLKQAEEMGKSI